MSEEKDRTENLVDAPADDAAAAKAGDSGAPAEAAEPKRKRTKRMIVVGVLAAILVVAGAGFWVWHEQPSFCGAICHSPMDPYLATYEGTTGQPGVDKWGNEVPDAGTMLAVAHKDLEGATCLTCHVPTIQEQAVEGIHWVSGTYLYPLEERSLTTLNAYGQNEHPEDFCTNEGCHNVTREELAQKTAQYNYNPHVVEVNHVQLECSDCHKAHRQPVFACSRCHEDADIPEGWLSASEAAELPTV